MRWKKVAKIVLAIAVLWGPLITSLPIGCAAEEDCCEKCCEEVCGGMSNCDCQVTGRETSGCEEKELCVCECRS